MTRKKLRRMVLKRANADLLIELIQVFDDMRNHLDYCSYGDAWERSGAENLMCNVDNTHEKLKEFGFTE